MSVRLSVARVTGAVEVRDDDDELILDLTPNAALWLAQHLIRQARLAMRDDAATTGNNRTGLTTEW